MSNDPLEPFRSPYQQLSKQLDDMFTRLKQQKVWSDDLNPIAIKDITARTNEAYRLYKIAQCRGTDMALIWKLANE